MFFGVSPSVGVKGNSKEEGAKKEYSPQMEKKKEIFYIQQFTFSFFFSSTPYVPFCSPENDTDKKGKCTEGKEERTIALC